jgi:HAE1 family hydrophobic/amphiphilic exporter-1
VKLSETAVRRPILTTMVIAALVVFGLVAYRTMGVALYPDVDIPVVTVTVIYEGASPDVVETEVTEPLEEALSTISGIKSMRSETSEGVSQVFIEFELETDVDVAAQDVRDKTASVRGELPTDIEAPVIEKFDPDSAPILDIVLSGPTGIRELTIFADDVVKPQIETIDGVGGVRLVGGREREVRVWLRLQDLKRLNLAAQDVIDALRKENVEFPGGRIESRQGEMIVKAAGRVEEVPDFLDLVLATRPSGLVRLRDVAFVEDGMEDERSIARLNGQRAVSLSIRQQSGTNMVTVADAVKEKLDAIRDSLPEGYELLLVQDLSEFVARSVADAQGELLRGGGLAVLVILLFLRSLRGAFVATVTIPATIISTYAFMLALGFTINMMTLLALSISVGMIIDDSIVVVENVFRHMQEGMGRVEAAIAAMREIGFAVLATSLAIGAVFIPVAFMDGLIGRFFFEFGMTVTFAVVVSTFIALTLSPMLCSQVLKLKEAEGRLSRGINSVLEFIELYYGKALRFALHHRLLVIVSAIGIFIASLALLPLIGKEFTPTTDEGQFSVQLEAPVGSSLAQTDRLTKEIETRMAEIPDVKDIYTTVGGQFEGSVNIASVMVKLLDSAQRSITQAQAIALAREMLEDLSHLKISVSPVERMSGGGFRSAPIQYCVRGNNLQEMEHFASQVINGMEGLPGIVDINTTSQSGKPEVSLEVNRNRAADLQVSVEDLGKVVQTLIGGRKVGTFEDAGENIDVRVRLIGAQRDRPANVATLPVRGGRGELTELGNLLTVHKTTGPAQIDREQRQRQITVLANLKPEMPLGEALNNIQSLEDEFGLPDGLETTFTGSAEMMAESFASILFALFLAVILTYMILSAQFESFLHPLTIMLSLPLSVGGALGALALTGRTLNIFSMIGMVMLMGW